MCYSVCRSEVFAYLMEVFFEFYRAIQVRNGPLGLSNSQIDSSSFEICKIVGWITIYEGGGWVVMT